MVPIKNSIICLIIAFNIIGIITNLILSNGKFCISDKDSFYRNGIEKMIVMILCGISIYFIMTLILIFNFNLQDPQEFQANQINYSNHSDQQNQRNQRNNANFKGFEIIEYFNCRGNGDGLGLLIIIIALISVVFLVIFLLVKLYKAMGRKNTAYCSIIFLTIIHMGISIICFGLIHHVNFYIIGGISSSLFIFNFLIILIPNCRKRQISNELENIEIKDPILMPQNGNNNILVRDNCVKTPLYNQVDNSKMNEIGKPIKSLNPINVFERNNEKPHQYFDDKNELLINQNDQISQTPNSRISDLSNAPLPNDFNLPTEEEIYKNYSNL